MDRTTFSRSRTTFLVLAIDCLLLLGCGDDDPGPLAPETDSGTPAGYEMVFGQPFGAADVRAFADDDVWVLGRNGHVSHEAGAPCTIEDVLGGWGMHGLGGSSASDLRMVGFSGKIVHFDGVEWAVEESPTSATLSDVWSATVDDAYAVGESGTILHFDGTRWTAETSGVAVALNDVSGANGGVRVIVGDSGVVLVKSAGGSWQRIDFGVDADLDAVWVASSDTFVAVGETVLRATRVAGAWQGSEDVLEQPLETVTGTSGSDVWAAGANGLWHFDGQAWSAEPATRRIVALDTAPDGSMAIQYDRDFTTMRRADLEWSFANGMGSFAVQDIDGIDDTHWTAYTIDGMTYRQRGDTIEVRGDAPFGIRETWSTPDGSSVFAVNGTATIHRFAYDQWTELHTVDSGARMIRIFGIGDELWVGGELGWTSHFDGSTWTDAQLETPYRNRYIHSISGSAADQVYALTTDSAFRFDGSQWTLFHEFGDGAFLDQILVADPEEIYVEGSYEYGSTGLSLDLHFFDGSQWTKPIQGSDHAIHDMAFSPDGEVVGVGISLVSHPLGFVVRGRRDQWEFDGFGSGWDLDALWISPSGTTFVFDGDLWRTTDR